MDKDLLLSKIIEISQTSTATIRFGGGEPLLYPQLFELLEDCKDCHIPIAMTINGTLLTAGKAKRLKGYNIKSLTISIDGTEKYNDFFRGRGSFARACSGVENALNANICPSLAFTATSLNYENLYDYVDHFYKMGIREFYIFRYIPDISKKRSESFELDRKMLMKTTSAILKIEKQYADIRLSYEKIGYLSFLLSGNCANISCKFTRETMTIKVDGTVIVCAAVPKKLGNIYVDGLKQIYANIAAEINSISGIPDECTDCSFNNICKGGCKCYSYIIYQNYHHMDNCCYKKLLLD